MLEEWGVEVEREERGRGGGEVWRDGGVVGRGRVGGAGGKENVRPVAGGRGEGGGSGWGGEGG